ncbi:hypothetical protein [Actinomadura atramentaria]|uniref:hypothetical protein n=1 Tax=Actinomadura atramentaria TaxID=1990 RepID=UPI00036C8D3C|nr:hypothetical protein [Actinomadura atramentaria]
MKRWISVAGTAAMAAVLATGCGSGGSGSSGPTKKTAPTPGHLEFEKVQPIAVNSMGKDPKCGYGEWNNGTFGIEEPFSKQTTFYREYSCYEKQGEVFPNAGAQMTFAVFGTEEQAKAYVAKEKDDVSLVAILLDGKTAVTLNIGYLTLNKMNVLKDVQASCAGCGTVVQGAHATDPVPGHVD